MKTVFKILKKVVLIGLGVYAALFAVFFFDLDGKALFYGVEPFRTASRWPWARLSRFSTALVWAWEWWWPWLCS